jgi:hypothetical protein
MVQPFDVTRQQLQKMGPVGLPDMGPQPESRADLEGKLRDLRELAAVGANNRFMSYLQKQQADAIQKLILAKPDEDVRIYQGLAKAWTAIYQQVVEAARQAREVEERMNRGNRVENP